MPTLRTLYLVLLILLATMPAMAATDSEIPDSLTRATGISTNDLDTVMAKARVIRVLVSYNRSNFFLVNGAMRGMEHDLMEAYKKYLRKQYRTKKLHMTFVALPFDKLLPALLEGRGDIVAAGLTITKEREKRVAFSAPYRKDINEIIVGSKKAAPIHKLEDLAGKKIYVMAGSSYGDHLLNLNKKLAKRGLKPVFVMSANDDLVTEDLLEMAERGLIDYTMADSHIAELWKTALPDIQLFTDVPVTVGGSIGWAVRPMNKQFKKSLSNFAKEVRQGTLMGNMTFNRYYKNTDWVKNPYAHEDQAKLDKLAKVFKKYGKEYNLDWLKLAALGFQESRLNMKTKSHRGAVGIMQVMPSTATSKVVNVKDYKTLDGNIHAGSKYLRYLIDNYFTDVKPHARIDFALAAYNAGPARIKQMQKLAKEMGLNPKLWFGNVEYAAYRKIGYETPTYVANVQIFYAAFKSINQTTKGRKTAL
jgi:membrane-bound lytic murein transglycosylase MltF